jgi:hypothetical protein
VLQADAQGDVPLIGPSLVDNSPHVARSPQRTQPERCLNAMTIILPNQFVIFEKSQFPKEIFAHALNCWPSFYRRFGHPFNASVGSVVDAALFQNQVGRHLFQKDQDNDSVNEQR